MEASWTARDDELLMTSNYHIKKIAEILGRCELSCQIRKRDLMVEKQPEKETGFQGIYKKTKRIEREFSEFRHMNTSRDDEGDTRARLVESIDEVMKEMKRMREYLTASKAEESEYKRYTPEEVEMIKRAAYTNKMEDWMNVSQVTKRSVESLKRYARAKRNKWKAEQPRV
jgi:molecular chaperone GrpE (heat shock protein)